MKLAVVTLNIGDVLHENSRESFKAAANRWQADYSEIVGVYPNSTIHATKFKVFEYVGADRIMYIDADTIIRGDCPNPFEIFTSDSIIAALNDTEHMPEGVRRDNADVYRTDMLKIFGLYPEVEFDNTKFVNSGMWLASRLHHPPLLSFAYEVSMALEGKTAWHDQTAFNYVILRLGNPVVLAGPEWNYQFPPKTLDSPMDQLIYHWAGDPEGRKTELPATNWRAESNKRFFYKRAPEVTLNEVVSPRSKPRLLLVADHCVPTGFARVAENICKRLYREWDLSVIALNYRGDPHKFPYPIYPAINGGDIWGMGKYRELLQTLNPDLAFAINDPWIIKQFCEIPRGDMPLAAYMPVDARNIPQDTCQALNNLELAIFYTEFGRRELETGGFNGKYVIIPHGVETGLYCPLDREKARNDSGLNVLLKDAFIVGNVNRNQPRKRLDLTVEYFAEWVHQYNLPPNVYLYIHTAQRDCGWNLAQLANYFGVSRRVILPAAEIVTPTIGLDEHEMPTVYNCFDVQISTTTGEGWGLSQIEGMACGIPQIVPHYSGLGEWTEDAALHVPCYDHMTHIGINTIGGIPDKHESVKALHRMYKDRDLRQDYGRRALTLVKQDRFRWAQVADQFQCCLGQMFIDRVAEVKTRNTATEAKEAQLAEA